jgi:hypothetical protein
LAVVEDKRESKGLNNKVIVGNSVIPGNASDFNGAQENGGKR